MEAELITSIKEKLAARLSTGFPHEVYSTKGSFGGRYICLWIACSTTEINRVQGQRPQMVSLMLDMNDMELRPQVFGGNGGQCIYRQPNLEDPKERYLAMKSVKIPFRKPKGTPEAIVECIGRFADNYIQTLNDNYDVLRYKEMVDYDKLLGRTKPEFFKCEECGEKVNVNAVTDDGCPNCTG